MSSLTHLAVRQRVHEGSALPEEITEKHLEDDGLLKPVLDDDALILCLDDLPEPSAPAGEAKQAELSGDALLQRNAELQNELEALAKQFNSYRLAVQQTLDTRWAEGDADAGAGATPDGPSGSAKAVGEASSSGAAKSDNDYSESYFASYARNGKIVPSPPCLTDLQDHVGIANLGARNPRNHAEGPSAYRRLP